MRYFLILAVLLSFQARAQSVRKLNKELQRQYILLILDYNAKYALFDSILQLGTDESVFFRVRASHAFEAQNKLTECKRNLLKKYDQLKDLEANKEIAFSPDSIANYQVPNLQFKELTESSEKYRVNRLSHKKYLSTLETKKIKDQNAEYKSLIAQLKNDTTELGSSTRNMYFARELLNRYGAIYDSMATLLNNDYLEMDKKLQVLNRIYKQAEERYKKNGPKGFNDYYARYFPDAFPSSKPVDVAYSDFGRVDHVAVEEAVAPPPASEEVVFEAVDVPAEFPGGINEMRRFLQEHLIYPEVAREKGYQGKCYVRFVVSENGTISNVVVKKGITDCPECDQEAVRVIKLMPKWKPGEIAGKPVNSFYTLPIKFTLSD